MKWEKLGMIFDFNDSPFAERFASHAQSPQALVLDDRVRVYFSTRINDQPGKFLSHVQYVDYAHDLKTVIGYSNHEVIALGKLGTFDEHGIFPLSPTRVGDKVYGYTNGIARRVSVAVETGVGFAISDNNGETFIKHGDGPLLSATTHEPFLVGDPFVREFEGEYHMYYLYGKKWSEATDDHAAERVYKIGHAVSPNGIDWVKENKEVIPDRIDEDECQALPTVMKLGGKYHMYFCYRSMIGFRDGSGGQPYQIGYAYSDDLKTWTRDDSQSGIDLSGDGWDSEMMCYPNIFSCNDEVYLLYNGNKFGRDGFGIAKLINR